MASEIVRMYKNSSFVLFNFSYFVIVEINHGFILTLNNRVRVRIKKWIQFSSMLLE